MAIKWTDEHYRWDKTFSRQVGTHGEFCLVIGGKDIGKTFGLRMQFIEDYLTKKVAFCSISRTVIERDSIEIGYFDKIQRDGFYTDYQFKTEKHASYINIGTIEEPQWELFGYFVALSSFQLEKQRTFVNPYRFVFDEAVIDIKDRRHKYLKDEYLILANLLDSISRQQPNDDYQYRVYLMGNACDMANPYFRAFKINKIPDYGYHWFNDKNVLLHYVEPWDAQERQEKTLVGRMLRGNDEAAMIFENKFADISGGEISKKSANAKFAYGLIYSKQRFGVWIDYKRGLFYINEYIPKDAKAVYVLAKKDGSINYRVLKKADDLMRILIETYYIGGLRYSSAFVRESFHAVLDFLGIK